MPRRRGPRRRQKREKNNAPKTKQAMEVSDFAQPYGLEMFRVEAPRPTKMVLPGLAGHTPERHKRVRKSKGGGS